MQNNKQTQPSTLTFVTKDLGYFPYDVPTEKAYMYCIIGIKNENAQALARHALLVSFLAKCCQKVSRRCTVMS